MKEENQNYKERMSKMGYNKKYKPYPIYIDKQTFEGYKVLK